MCFANKMFLVFLAIYLSFAWSSYLTGFKRVVSTDQTRRRKGLYVYCSCNVQGATSFYHWQLLVSCIGRYFLYVMTYPYSYIMMATKFLSQAVKMQMCWCAFVHCVSSGYKYMSMKTHLHFARVYCQVSMYQSVCYMFFCVLLSCQTLCLYLLQFVKPLNLPTSFISAWFLQSI